MNAFRQACTTVSNWLVHFALALRAFLYSNLFGTSGEGVTHANAVHFEDISFVRAVMMASTNSTTTRAIPRSSSTSGVSAMMYLAELFKRASAANVKLDTLLPFYDADGPQRKQVLLAMRVLPIDQRKALTEDVLSLLDKSRRDNLPLVHMKGMEVLRDLCESAPDVPALLLADPAHLMALLADYERLEVRTIAMEILRQVLSCTSAASQSGEEETSSSDARMIVAMGKAILVVEGANHLLATVEKVPLMIKDFARCLATPIDLNRNDEDGELFVREAVSLLRVLSGAPAMTARMFDCEGLVESLLRLAGSDASAMEVRENAFACLFKIASTPANTDRMFHRAGVIDSLLSCVDTCQDELVPLNVSEWGVVILLVLFNTSDANQQVLFRQTRALECFIAAVNSPRTKSARLREWAVGGLMVLISATGNRREAIKLTCHLVNVLRDKEESATLKEHALLGLTGLSLDADNLTELKGDKALLFALMDVCLAKASEEQSEKVRERSMSLMTKLGCSVERAANIRSMLVVTSAYDVPSVATKSRLRMLDRDLMRLVGKALVAAPTTTTATTA